jgi:hypothetical protein
MTAELTPPSTESYAWVGYIARGMAHQLASEPSSTLGATWARIPRDYQTAVWKLLAEPQRERIRKVRARA